MIASLVPAIAPDLEHDLRPSHQANPLEAACGPVFLIGQRNLALEGLWTLLLKHGIRVDGIMTSVNDLGTLAVPDSRHLLVIFDVTGDIEDQRDKINEFRLCFPTACIILLLSHFHKDIALIRSKLRVNAILDRNIACEALIKTLHVALAGYAVLSHVSESDLPEPSFRGFAEAVKPPGLSDRELEIIGCIAEGQSNKVIARRFSISEATVKIHVRGILRKVDARNRTQAAVWALQQGFGTEAGATLS